MQTFSAAAKTRSQLLAIPVMGWLIWFLVIPMAIIIVYSFMTRGPYGGVVMHANLDNYLRVGDFIYLKIFWNSLQLPK